MLQRVTLKLSAIFFFSIVALLNLAKESRKDFTLGQKVEAGTPVGTMVLLNQQNPSVSTASFAFRYVLRAKTFVKQGFHSHALTTQLYIENRCKTEAKICITIWEKYAII